MPTMNINPNAILLREAVERVVGLLTASKIKVTMRGSGAFVEYSPKGAITRVNLPSIPDDATDEFLAAVQGFLDHEVAHVLFSDPKTADYSKMDRRVVSMADVIEDAFIENAMSKAYSGSEFNLNKVREFFIHKIAAPKVAELVRAGDTKQAQGWLIVQQVRAWGGQRVAADWFKANPKYAALISDFTEAVGDLAEQVPLVKSTKDGLHLAERIIKRIQEVERKKEEERKKAEEKAKAEKDKDKKPEESKSGDKPDKPEKPKKGDKGEKGDKPPKEDKGEPEKPKEDKGDKGDDADGDASEGDEAGEGDDAASGKGKSPSTPKDEDKPEDKPEPKAKSKGDGEAKPEEDDAPGEGTDETASDDGEAAGEGGEGEGDDDPEAGDKREGEGSTKVEAGSGMKPPTGTTEDDTDEPTPSGVTGPSMLDSLDTDDLSFDEGMAEKLSEMGKKALATSQYAVPTHEFDTVEPAPASSASISRLDDLGQMVGQITKQLERAIASRSRVGFNPGMRKGRINAPALHRVASGDDRIFRQRYETRSRATAISLLIDCSSSMFAGDRIGTAGKAAFALSSALERLRIKHEVLGFTTKKSTTYREAMRDSSRITWAREEALYMPVFKGFDQRLDADARGRIAALLDRPSWLRENVDGESVMIAARRLALVPNVERRILMVLSDGSPACPGNWSALHVHLKETVKRIEQDMEVVGIGVQSNSVKEFYSKSITLNNLDDLPVTVMKQLSDLLLKQ
jgi:cobaltochelatase CobT